MSKQTDSLANSTIAVWGLGLMGGSLCLRLKGQCAKLIGIDPNEDVIELAKNLDIADEFSSKPHNVIMQANMIILAAPIHGILQQIEALPGLQPNQCILLDLGTTKEVITDKMKNLPPNFNPLGGHPLCGKENSGLENADANLYENATVALVELKRTSAEAKRMAEELLALIGANPLNIEAKTHDNWISHTITLPYLAANLISGITPAETAPMVGPGFLSTTRLAVQSSEMMLQTLSTCPEKSEEIINDLVSDLLKLKENLKEKKYQSVEKQFSIAAEQKKQILQTIQELQNH